MGVPGDRLQLFHRALLAAFDEAGLARLVRFHLDCDLGVIAGSGDLSAKVFDVLDHAAKTGRLERLMLGALAENPGSQDLRGALLDHGEFRVNGVETAAFLAAMMRRQADDMEQMRGQIASVALAVDGLQRSVTPLGRRVYWMIGFILYSSASLLFFYEVRQAAGLTWYTAAVAVMLAYVVAGGLLAYGLGYVRD